MTVLKQKKWELSLRLLENLLYCDCLHLPAITIWLFSIHYADASCYNNLRRKTFWVFRQIIIL